ncbi:MAG: cob(I)yrinic acid a,c-diamide adenosyltransferase [Bacteroidetes bacterium]|nr:cob(I)yrinic acid a,c-diamide adenosyltransferase [Bacteroidota bacterium]
MKIYTKTGDKGETSLFGSKRISKDDLVIEAYGTVDELNSVIGIVRSLCAEHDRPEGNEYGLIDGILKRVQQQLFVLGADLASPAEVKSTALTRISSDDYAFLERSIDEIDSQLPDLKSFVLPGGSKTAAFLHEARTVCRRAERRVVSLKKHGNTSDATVIYLNRLSDLLFILARYSNKISGDKEILWNPRGESERSV